MEQYYIFYDKNTEKLNGCGQCRCLNEEIENIEVSEELYNAYTENPDMYIWDGNEIVENPNYEAEQAQKREKQFNKDFFNTSLGYVRRKVSMATGETKDFLSDLLPTISMGVQMGKPVTIITYNKPDFTQEITDWTVFQNEQTVTAEFVQECFMQLSNDFKPVNNEVQDDSTTDTAE